MTNEEEAIKELIDYSFNWKPSISDETARLARIALHEQVERKNHDYHETLEKLKANDLTFVNASAILAPPTESVMKCGNITVNSTRRFNWLQRRVWNVLLGFEIQNTGKRRESEVSE